MVPEAEEALGPVHRLLCWEAGRAASGQAGPFQPAGNARCHLCCLSPAHRQKLREADLELQRKREYIEELEPPTDGSSEQCSTADGGGRPELGVDLRGHFVPPADRRIEELQDSLQKKDADLRAMEERYRRYVDKARTVRML